MLFLLIIEEKPGSLRRDFSVDSFSCAVCSDVHGGWVHSICRAQWQLRDGQFTCSGEHKGAWEWH